MYDVFICYHRATGIGLARLLKAALEQRHYTVFFDCSDVRDGLIDCHIELAVREAKVFLLVMTEGVLDGCLSVDNWVRREIDLAYKCGAKIVPVAPSNGTWHHPAEMPWKKFKSIPVSKLDMEEWFDLTLDGIIKERFPSHSGASAGQGATSPTPETPAQDKAESLYNLALRYSKGDGVERDASKAAIWYRKAAEQGYAPAQLNLGHCYADGNGVERNLVEAAAWYRKAAEQGHAKAQCAFGLCYAIGKGVERDAVRAVSWWRKAAEQGDVSAQYNLGVCYAEGKVVNRDVIVAAQWYRKAADQGDVLARKALDAMWSWWR